MALAADANAASALVNPGTSVSWTHAMSAAGDPIIFAGGLDDNGASSLITGIAWDPAGANTPFTKIGGVLDDVELRWVTLWVCIPGSTGSKTITATASGNCALRFMSASYTGASATGQPDGSTTNHGTSTTLTTTTTVTATGCWLVSVVKENQATATTGITPGIERQSPGNGIHLYDSNGTVGTGSQTHQVTYGTTAGIGMVTASFAPVGAAPPASGRVRHSQLTTLGMS